MDMLSDLAVKKLSPQPSTNSSRSSSPRCRKLKPSSDQNNRKYRKLKPSSDQNNRQTPVLFQVTTQVGTRKNPWYSRFVWPIHCLQWSRRLRA